MYLIKLKIEMNMADLIVKIVKATAPTPGHELHRYAASQAPNPRPNAQSRTNSDNSKKHLTAGVGNGEDASSHTQTAPVAPIATASTESRSSTWELKQMPSYFDAHDVVDTEQRRVSEAEGTVGMVAFPLPVRPALMRNMSEMTQLEIGAGYLNESSRERKSAALGEDPLC